MIRVHFTYRHVDAAWGGANNFIRAIKTELAQDDRFQCTDTVDAPCDIVFMNQLGKGPGGNGRRYKLAQVRRWKAEGRRIVVRAVNLNRHAFRMGLRNMTLGWLQDRQTIALLNLADVVIFQSAYQREFFLRAGYKEAQNCIIHNGASRFFWVENPCAQPLDGQIRLVSSTASARETKRHDLIAKISMCDGVEVVHLGVWPEGLPTAQVRLLGMQPHEEMLKTLAQAHFFLHPALNDPCPNAVFEALCAGLPVIYNPGPGSSTEIVGYCGLPLDESNLVNTAREARSRYSELRDQVLKNRHRFAIDAATSGYRDVFLQLAKNPLAR
ncbi:glycosyltransferase [Ferribacterium limneticum]|uniref:glycosyltransferase n=1 Tax=Ferribacterium limneticum TaxID=76259 RepID=UPI001CFBDF8A|nr:glycosyltransferase [Ferribacterium limneticum]UCV28965.1 glycosyltransferase family 4 protein [Ferribacterium limneticum]UCV32883.1 glycosyltransferase family 4 protein [Ferribacterium limneticum]